MDRLMARAARRVDGRRELVQVLADMDAALEKDDAAQLNAALEALKAKLAAPDAAAQPNQTLRMVGKIVGPAKIGEGAPASYTLMVKRVDGAKAPKSVEWDANFDGLNFQPMYETAPDQPWTYLWPDNRKVRIAARLRDEAGGVGNPISFAVEVVNTAPTVEATLSAKEITLGQGVDLTVTARDPGGAREKPQVEVFWNYRDGADPDVKGPAGTFHFQPDKAGRFVVAVRGVDKDGAIGKPVKLKLTVKKARR